MASEIVLCRRDPYHLGMAWECQIIDQSYSPAAMDRVLVSELVVERSRLGLSANDWARAYYRKKRLDGGRIAMPELTLDELRVRWERVSQPEREKIEGLIALEKHGCTPGAAVTWKGNRYIVRGLNYADVTAYLELEGGLTLHVVPISEIEEVWAEEAK